MRFAKSIAEVGSTTPAAKAAAASAAAAAASASACED
jgi:hypothetical protein